MAWSTTTPFYYWLISSLILAAGIWLWRPKITSIAVLVLLNFALYELFWLMTLNWLIPNFYWRALPIVLPFALILRLRGKLKPRPVINRPPAPLWPDKSPASRSWVIGGLVVLLVLVYINVRVFLSYEYKSSPNKPVLLLLPLRNGMYLTVNGGNGWLGFGLNNRWHAWPGAEYEPDKKMIYAVDLVKANTAGNIFDITYPKSSFQYYLGFTDFVYTPCLGTVVYLEDGHPDVIPPKKNESLLGNYLVIQCQDYYITLGGFKNGSFLVKEGDSVRFGMSLGLLGSSGTPSIPHLHIHTTVNGITGDPVPMLFDGWLAVDQFPVRNQIFIP